MSLFFFCQHSVNTQYCIKAINSHFKETETQFNHQSREQQLGGLRNVSIQLAAPPPPTAPPPQVEGTLNNGLCQAVLPLPHQVMGEERKGGEGWWM